MSTPNQIRFCADVKKAFTDAHAEAVKLAQQREEFRRKVDDGVLQPEYADSEIDAINRKIATIRDECESKAHALIAARLEELDAAEALNAEELNADCELLKFDVLSQKDIDQLAKRNSSNPTVSRLIQRYAEAHGFTVSLPSYIMELSAARKEARDMQEIARVCSKWVGDGHYGQGVLDRLFVGYGV